MGKNRHLINVLAAALITGALFYACHPERSYEEDPDARLTFSVDTLFFDTVFTTVGTVTESFRVKNPHNRFIMVDEIYLAGGASSVFRINVDGRPGTMFSGVEIAPGDSMYIFVEATLDPNASAEILRIQDSIVFLTNGNLQDVDLVAWGQDVHILRDSVITGQVSWSAEKPYLIIDYVYVDSMATLTLEPGTRVHLHKDALLFVDGTLEVLGTLDDPVNFSGDRLEDFYDDIPGQWGLIYLSASSHDNLIEYAEIRNGTFGVLISAPPESGEMPDLVITNTFINQMSATGLYALNASVTGQNLVIGNCGGSCTDLVYGGSYEFTHCTFANFFPTYFNRKLPALLLQDYFGNYDDEGNLTVYTGGKFEKADFRNSIIYGNKRAELVLDSYDGSRLEYLFDHCLMRINEDSIDYQSDPDFTAIINNQNPLFDSIPYSFELDTLSPAIDAGLPAHAVGVPFDLNGNNRLEDEAPDLGAYERIEQ